MNLLLRIIDQSLSGSEQSVNYPLGDTGYTTVHRVNNGIGGNEKTLFQTCIDEYFKGVPCSDEERENVSVVVFGQNNTHVVKSNQVAYIVNSEGKTIERVHGQYIKY